MSLVVLDTDVASRLIVGKDAEAINRLLVGKRPAITFVTVGELTKWTLVRHWGPRRLLKLQTFLSEVVILPYSSKVAITWGDVQVYAQLRGRPRPANDTWIAACCLYRDLPLATYNRKDFVDLADHEGLELLSM